MARGNLFCPLGSVTRSGPRTFLARYQNGQTAGTRPSVRAAEQLIEASFSGKFLRWVSDVRPDGIESYTAFSNAPSKSCDVSPQPVPIPLGGLTTIPNVDVNDPDNPGRLFPFNPPYPGFPAQEPVPTPPNFPPLYAGQPFPYRTQPLPGVPVQEAVPTPPNFPQTFGATDTRFGAAAKSDKPKMRPFSLDALNIFGFHKLFQNGGLSFRPKGPKDAPVPSAPMALSQTRPARQVRPR